MIATTLESRHDVLPGQTGSDISSMLYHRLADAIERSIDQGIFRAGERIPSVRQASQQHRISINTVVRAYLLLESRGVIESRPQSGFFVRPRVDFSAMASPASAACDTGRLIAMHDGLPGPSDDNIDVTSLVLGTLRAIQQDNAMPLGSPYPDTALLPSQRIAQYVGVQARRCEDSAMLDGLPPGHPALIRQLARRYVERGQPADPNEFIVTCGATEAVRLCLQAVARPGDAVVVESPCYYGMLETITHLGMRAIEIPSDASGSIDMALLRETLDTQTVAACVITANFPNPLGRQMPEDKKRELVELLTGQDIPIVENDEYSELYVGAQHPTSLKTYDTRGLVLHCGSFSRCLTHRHRIGWALPGRFRQQVEKLKFLSAITTPPSVQLAIAEYLQHDGYDHHLRRLRRRIVQNASIAIGAIRRCFPAGTRVHAPEGGYLLWIELPHGVDTLAMYRSALACGISIAPGRLFGSDHRFANFLRLNFSGEWTSATDRAIQTLGQLATASMATSDRPHGLH
ncbi:DNA-binding transcriptional MocR family regulator [Cupriavidus plantarum]|nr:DNA-binding transcriptional MocR family regulator [Cupriavidus plantarum]